MLGAARRAQRQEAHSFELDGDVGNGERHCLAIADRLAERDAVVAIFDDVVEHGLCRADRERRPADAREVHHFFVGGGRRLFAEQRVRFDAHVGKLDAPERRAAYAHSGLGAARETGGSALDAEIRRDRALRSRR